MGIVSSTAFRESPLYSEMFGNYILGNWFLHFLIWQKKGRKSQLETKEIKTKPNDLYLCGRRTICLDDFLDRKHFQLKIP